GVRDRLPGGEGKRLAPLTLDRAKPAVPFGGNTSSTSPYRNSSAPRAPHRTRTGQSMSRPRSASSCSRSMLAPAVVLADGLHRAGVVQLASVRGHHRLRMTTRFTAEPDGAQVVLEVGIRIPGDQPLGERSRLGEEPPVPVDERQAAIGAPPHL